MSVMKSIFLASIFLISTAYGIGYSVKVISPCQDDVADKDIPVSGIVSGNYTYTHSSDNKYEAITEIKVDRKSYLEHKWTINVTSGNKARVTFYLEAYRIPNKEKEDFVFTYSLDDDRYTDMIKVTKTSDDNSYQSFNISKTINGSVYIRIRDMNRREGETSRGSIYIDHMFIRSFFGDTKAVYDSTTCDTDPSITDANTDSEQNTVSSSVEVFRGFLDYVYRLFTGG